MTKPTALSIVPTANTSTSSSKGSLLSRLSIFKPQIQELIDNLQTAKKTGNADAAIEAAFALREAQGESSSSNQSLAFNN